MNRKLTSVASATALVLALTCSISTQAAEFRYAYSADLDGLDPHSNPIRATSTFLSNTYETLVKYNDDLKFVPGLATEWSVNDDATVWRFNLRRGVKFSNDNDFTADDVIFSYKRQSAATCPMNWVYQGIAELRKIDDHTVEFVVSKPNPILLNNLASGYIMDKEWTEGIGASACTAVSANTANPANIQAMGTGPFEIKERVPAVRTVLVPNANWWGEPRHNLTKVTLTPIQDNATRVAALLSGEVDLAYPIPVQDINRIDSNKGTKVLVGPELRTVYLIMEQGRAKLNGSSMDNPFRDVRVRKAFYQAIDIDTLNRRILGGRATPLSGLIPPQVFEGIKDIKRYPYDPKAATALLKEAGHADGFTANFYCSDGRYAHDAQICQAIASMSARVGIKLNLTTEPPAQYFQRVLNLQERNYNVGIHGWFPATLDSHHLISNVLASLDDKQGTGRYNVGFTKNDRIDELTAMIGSEQDKRRDEMIAEVYRIVHENVYIIPLYQQYLAWGIRDNVTLNQRADDTLVFDSVRVQ